MSETAMEEGRRERNPIASATRLVAILSEHTDDAVGVRELARLLDLTASSVQKTLERAAEAGLVSALPEGRWTLGWELYRIAANARHKLPFGNVQPVLDAVRDASAETAVLTIYDAGRGERMFVAASESRHSVRFVPPLMQWLPMHVGATALAILAFRPEAERGALIARSGLSDQERQSLSTTLDKIQDGGSAVSHDQVNIGGSAIAVPVQSRGGVSASLGVIMPKERFESADLLKLGQLLQGAAAQISGAVG